MKSVKIIIKGNKIIQKYLIKKSDKIIKKSGKILIKADKIIKNQI